MNVYELAKLQDKFLEKDSLNKEQDKFKPKGNIPGFKDKNHYYCSDCGNPIDSLGKNIPKKKLSKWDFMNAKPMLGNCCNPY